MLVMKKSVLSLRQSKTTLVFLHPASTKIIYNWPVKYYFWRFWYIIYRLLVWVQLSIYSTRALFHSTVWLWSKDEYV